MVLIVYISPSQSKAINEIDATDTLVNTEKTSVANSTITKTNTNNYKVQELAVTEQKPLKNEIITSNYFSDNSNIIAMFIVNLVKKIFEVFRKIDFTEIYSEENLERLAVFLSQIFGLFLGPHSQILRTLLVPMVSSFAMYMLRLVNILLHN